MPAPSFRQPTSITRRILIGATAGAATLLLATSCAASGSNGTGASDAGGPAPGAYPLTVDNCGTEVTFERSPERVLTIKSSTTELMIALGLGDRVIGQAYPDGDVPDEIAGRSVDDTDIPIVSDSVPGQEAVLDLEPDLIFGGWESNFTGDGVGDRSTLATLGVASYVAPSACKEAGYQPDPLTFDDVFAHITEAGAIFDVPDAAADLVEAQQAVLDGIERASSESTALWWSSGTDTPYVGGGIGAPQMIMDEVGLTNIAASIDDTWGPFNWESIVDANPDVLVLADAAWNTAESKIESLRANPATAVLDAVLNERFVIVPFASTEAGVRNADAAADIADQLHGFGS